MKYTAIYTHNLLSKINSHTHRYSSLYRLRGGRPAGEGKRLAGRFLPRVQCTNGITLLWSRAMAKVALGHNCTCMNAAVLARRTGHSTLWLTLAARTKPIFLHLGMCMSYFTVSNFQAADWSLKQTIPIHLVIQRCLLGLRQKHR